jgi:tetratricopeptide (TPR) repeat protein
LQEARLELERYLANDPRDRQARTIYIVLLYQLKDYQAAIRNADIILAEQPLSMPVLLYRGLARQAADQLDSAIADFQAVASAPEVEKGERVFALNMVADIEFRRQNYAGALAALDSMVKMQKDFDTYFRQGVALEGLQRLAEADAAYHQALSLASDPAGRSKALRALGENAKKRQDLEGAKQAFETALELDPRNPELMRALADIAYPAATNHQA